MTSGLPEPTLEQLVEAYHASRRRDPCRVCKKIHPMYHHPDCWGRNLCHDCYMKETPVTQLYPGDRGYPPYFGPLPIPLADRSGDRT